VAQTLVYRRPPTVAPESGWQAIRASIRADVRSNMCTTLEQVFERFNQRHEQMFE
jgi:hypothetical protein